MFANAARWMVAIVAMCTTGLVQAITCNELDGAYLVSQDASPKYLGFFGSQFATDSVMNPYGTYGSKYSVFSVRNNYGSYGSAYSALSALNPYASKPPVIARSGQFLGFLTTNAGAGALGVSLAQIDASCTNLMSGQPAGPLSPPQIPSFTPPAPQVITLPNGAFAGPMIGSAGAYYDFVISVPQGATRLVFVTDGDASGNSGDVTLFVRRGALPLSNAYDCRSQTSSSPRESCVIDSPQAGSWYATVYGDTSFQNVYIVGGYQISNFIGAHSAGIFWNPSRSGEGMQIVYSQVGTTPFLAVTFYTYDLQGNPMYLVGAAPIDRSKAGPHAIPISMTRGARFGSAFNPSDVAVTSWGTINLTFADCDNVIIEYSSTISGYGAGTIPMTRSLPRAEGLSCP